MSFHYRVKASQTLGQLFSFISMLSYSLKLSLMVKAGFFLVVIFFFLLNMNQMPPTQLFRWLSHLNLVNLYFGSSTSQGAKCENSTMVSRYQLSCAMWPNADSLTISLMGSVICPFLEAQINLLPNMSLPFFFRMPKNSSRFCFLYSCLLILHICSVAVQFPSHPCPNVAILYCCLLRNER